MTDSEKRDDLRKLPSVNALLQTADGKELIEEYGHALVVEAIRQVLGNIRKKVGAEQGTIPLPDLILQAVMGYLQSWTSPTLEPVINATGVILHTNLGRAPLSTDTINAMQKIAQGYSTLEYDLEEGKRGSRYLHTEDLLKHITGAEAGLVVNNNASALLLILSALSYRRRTLIARSQLVEIGGGFRIPDVMTQSGAVLEEIGATNRVHIEDYQRAIEELPIKMVMRVHRSNFKMMGFIAEPSLDEIIAVSHAAGLPVVDDLGSGSFLDTAEYGLAHEMTVMESLSAGSDLVCFSGDKLLGGPQAGIIVGRKVLVDKLRKHPVARAVRADKLALSGLSATLLHYLKGEAEMKIPIWQMISMKLSIIESRANQWARMLRGARVVEGESAVGGGSLPGEMLPTYLVALPVSQPDLFLKRLRQSRPPVVARVEDGQVMIDPRSVLPQQEGALLVELQNAISRWGN